MPFSLCITQFVILNLFQDNAQPSHVILKQVQDDAANVSPFTCEASVVTAPIIITAEMGKADQAWANGLRRAHYPADRNMVDAHITLFHHLPPGHIAEVKARLAALAAECTAPKARLSDLMNLGGGVA